MADSNIPEEQENTPEPSGTELKAMESGWVPKEQFDGEEHKWVEAAEFLRRGELFKKIEDQSKQLKDVRKSLDDMKRLHGQVREVEYKRALDELRVQKKTALEEGNADAVISVDERIDLVKEAQKQHQVQSSQEETTGSENPEFTAWTDRNSWYKNSSPMKAFADAYGKELSMAGNSPSEVLRKVEAEVRKEFPNKFRNPNQDKAGAVESGTNRSTSKSTIVLTDEERQIMNRFVRTGALTEKQYMEDIKKVRG